MHDNEIEKENAQSKEGHVHAVTILQFRFLLARLPNQTSLYSHPEHVSAFSPHCVSRCKFTVKGSNDSNFFLSPTFDSKKLISSS